MNFSDLRAILHYVPQFRGRTFVVALDGAVIGSPEFSDILLDLAVLRSLNIRIVLVHGAAAQIEALGRKRGVALSNADGTGITDDATLEVSIDAISRLGNALMQSLTTVKLRTATANAVHAHPAGMLRGVDSMHTGAVERIDSGVLEGLLAQDVLPVVPPLGFDADGQTLRVNSDAVAREVAVALKAAKILFVSADDPLPAIGAPERTWSSESVIEFLRQRRDLDPGLASKLKNAADAARDGVTRVHLIGTRNEDALLAELFSNEGVGLMVYTDAYCRVRPAAGADVDELQLLIHRAVEDEMLLPRSRADILARIADYLVVEVDRNVVGCVAVHPDESGDAAELACLFVKRGHTGQGYGRLLVAAARERAKQLGKNVLFALSTQAAGYLEREGFRRSEGLERLPPSRRAAWSENGRNAIILESEV